MHSNSADVTEPELVIHRFLRANCRGWSKYHLVPAEEKVALCKTKVPQRANGRFSRTVEDAYRELIARTTRRFRTRDEVACKRCLQAAQKLRNPLDRLAEI